MLEVWNRSSGSSFVTPDLLPIKLTLSEFKKFEMLTSREGHNQQKVQFFQKISYHSLR
jgi:hypothetical protein